MTDKMSIDPLPDGYVSRREKPDPHADDAKTFLVTDCDCIVLHPDDDGAPVISYYLSDGTQRLKCFATDAECEEAWKETLTAVNNQGYFSYRGEVLMRAERVKKVESNYSEALGHHLNFFFHGTHQFTQCYGDDEAAKKSLSDDQLQIAGVFSKLFERRATTHPEHLSPQ